MSVGPTAIAALHLREWVTADFHCVLDVEVEQRAVVDHVAEGRVDPLMVHLTTGAEGSAVETIQNTSF